MSRIFFPHIIFGDKFFFTLYPWGTGKLVDTNDIRKQVTLKRHQLYDLFVAGSTLPLSSELVKVIPQTTLERFLQTKERNIIRDQIIHITEAWNSDKAYIYDEDCATCFSLKEDEFKKEIYIEAALFCILRDTVPDCIYCPPNATWRKLGYTEGEAHKVHVVQRLNNFNNKNTIENYLRTEKTQKLIATICNNTALCCLTQLPIPEALNYMHGNLDLTLMIVKERLMECTDPESRLKPFTGLLRSYLAQNKFSYISDLS